MGNIHTFSTIVYRDTEVEEKDVVVYFSVPEEWAKNWCEANGYNSLEEFDEDYIWDNSYELYMSAVEDNVIVCIEEDENVIRVWR